MKTGRLFNHLPHLFPPSALCSLVMRVMLRMFYDLIPMVFSPFLDDLAIKGPITTYNDEEVEGLPGVRRYIAEYICHTDQRPPQPVSFHLSIQESRDPHLTAGGS